VKCGGRPYVPDQALFSLFYSPNLVEDEFCQVRGA
jgi:hypothetical protein